MSNDDKHSVDDLLEGTKGDDSSMDGEATEETDEQSDQLDDLPNEKAKQKFITDWARKIEAKEATLDDLRAKQSWLVPGVEALLSSKKKLLGKEEFAEVARTEARKIMEEERMQRKLEDESSKFDSLKGQLKSLGLSPEQKATIKSTFDKYSNRLSAYDALVLAAEVAKVDFEDDIVERRRKVASPKVGYGSRVADKEYDFAKLDPNTLDREERFKLVTALREGR